jgi:hypothetical protein
MTPQTDRPDPEFLRAISAPIRGIFAGEVDKFKAPFVESEFRKIVRQSDLVSNDGLMDTLMFVVRKKDIIALRPDVIDAIQKLPLKPHAELSALKTLYAIGGDADRAVVDDRFARRLYDAMKASDGVPDSPFLDNADRVGGAKTLAVLKSLLPDVTARQREAEAKTPRDYTRVSALDQVRSSISGQIFTLTRKLTILSAPEPRRTMDLFQLCSGTAGPLHAWSYRELAGHPSQGRIDVLRRIDPQPIEALMLLRDMNAQLTPEETEILQKKAYPTPDWEAVLDK